MTYLNAPVPRRTDTPANERPGSDATVPSRCGNEIDPCKYRAIHNKAINDKPHGENSSTAEHIERSLRGTGAAANERGSLARLSPHERFEARRLARERAGAGLPSGPRLFLPPRLILSGLFATIRHQPKDIRRDAAYMVGRLPYAPAVTGLENLPAQRPYVILSNHYERRPGAWVGWSASIVTDAIARAQTGSYPIRWVMTSSWQDCHIGPRYIDPRHLRWALQRFADLYGIILTPADDRRAFGRGAALRDLFHALSDPVGQVVAFHPEAGGTRSLITPPPGIGRLLSLIDRRGVPLVPVGVFEDGTRYHVTFGRSFAVGSLADYDDAQVAARVMRAIAELLPLQSRGVYFGIDAA